MHIEWSSHAWSSRSNYIFHGDQFVVTVLWLRVQVKVLRSMRTPCLQDFCLGQYKASISKDGKSKIRGYLEEPGVDSNSLTPTFVAGVLYIDNSRWDGVPFLIKAGYGLIKHKYTSYHHQYSIVSWFLRKQGSISQSTYHTMAHSPIELCV